MTPPIKHGYIRNVKAGTKLLKAYDCPAMVVVGFKSPDSKLVTNIHSPDGKVVAQYPANGRCVILKGDWELDDSKDNSGRFLNIMNPVTGETMNVCKGYMDVHRYLA